MNKRIFCCALCALLLALSVPVEAQQPTQVPRIGYLSVNALSRNVVRIEAFRQGLRQLGYVEGKNIFIEWRSAEGIFDRVTALAAELVRLKVDVIVTGGSRATRPAKAATSTIPIVMASDNDPVGNKFIASLARPGGNITGLSRLSPELNGKRIELLKEIDPNLSRVSVFGDSANPGNAHAFREVELAAKALGLTLQYLDVLDPKDVDTSFRAASEGRADAVLVIGSPRMNPQREKIVGLAAKYQLPAIYNRPSFVVAGGLMTYSVSGTDMFRRAAAYVDKILKGRKPADLPVEQPSKFELIINLKAAKRISLTIPETVLYRADKVIK